MKYIFAIFFFVLPSCTSHHTYEDGIKRYLKEVHQLSNENLLNHIFYIISFDNCDCAEKHIKEIEKIETFPPNFALILISRNKELDYDYLSKKRIRLILDTKSRISKYETGMGKPILVHFSNGQIKHYHYVIDGEIDDAINYLTFLQ